MSDASNQLAETSANDIEQFVQGSLAGDRDSQRKLYEVCLPLVYRLAARMVGNQDAPDVAQQTFLRAFSHLDQYEGQAKFETWLYRLTVNESLQYLRKRQRWSQPSLESEPMDERHQASEDSELGELLEQALSRLDPELRSIFLLRESEELSYHEIAEALEIPEGTVGSRLNRARRELQQHLIVLGWTP